MAEIVTAVQREASSSSAPESGAATSGSSPGQGAVRGALRCTSFAEGAEMLAPRAPGGGAGVQRKLAGEVQRHQGDAVQREEDPAKLAASILAAVQSDYKTSPIRQAYEAEVAALKAVADGLLTGKDKTQDGSIEDVARAMNQKRLDIGKKYKELTILPLRDYIFFANSQRYDTAYGPSYEWLKNKGKNNMQVIEGSYRPNPDINAFLAPFGDWLKGKSVGDLKKYQSAVGSG